jgi:ATP-dependent Clp protease protease subunit
VPLVPPAGPTRHLEDRGLLEHRTVLLTGRLDDEVATRVAAQVMTLDAEGSDEIALHVACEGGELLAALMLAETIGLVSAPIRAVAKGVVGEVALAPFAAAARRTATPRASFRLAEPQLSISGAASEITAEADNLRRHVARLHTWVSDATGQPLETVALDMERRRTLDVDEALAYGLIDEVATRTGRAKGDGGTIEEGGAAEEHGAAQDRDAARRDRRDA